MTVITGFAGQISLCQGTFAAIGAFTAYLTESFLQRNPILPLDVNVSEPEYVTRMHAATGPLPAPGLCASAS